MSKDDDEHSWSVDGGDSSEGDDRPYGMDSIEQEKAEEAAVAELTRRETRGVQMWRIFTLLSLIAVSVAVSTITFRLLRDQEKDEFEDSYKFFTAAIQNAANVHVRNVFGTSKMTAGQITKAALETGQTFPFVTVDHFEILGRQFIHTLQVEQITWSPLIDVEEYAAWTNYSTENIGWLNQSVELNLAGSENDHTIEDYNFSDTNYEITAAGGDLSSGPWSPIWQTSPPPFNSELINFDMYSLPVTFVEQSAMDKLRRGVMSETGNLEQAAVEVTFESVKDVSTEHDEEEHAAEEDEHADEDTDGRDHGDSHEHQIAHPHSLISEPVFASLFVEDTTEIVGYVYIYFTWDHYMMNLLPEGVSGITVVLKNSCGQSFSYALDGKSATYLGAGDMHDTRYNHMETIIPFFSVKDASEEEALKNTPGHCLYYLHIYPTKEYEDRYDTTNPIKATTVLVFAFAFMITAFLMYDCFVVRRNRKLLNAMTRTNAIVSSLFPSNVRDRIFADAKEDREEKKALNGKSRLKTFLSGNDDDDLDDDVDEDDKYMYKTKPIADLFPETTVLFADLAGFTAWSSMREPTQVFILLETIYKAMDDIAKARRVFKVETVGDCYVAVTGLPDPRKDHAVAMCRFALDCVQKMNVLTKKLEVILGPDTTDLQMRVGLHSGPVTAGVLRGERSRFQLFGDTMNTASRMESNGLPGKIHMSQETAELLVAAGKEHWVIPREEKVVAKGKGELQTYWLVTTKASNNTRSETASSETSGEHSESLVPEAVFDTAAPVMDEKTDRLVQWNVEVLATLLKKVVTRRQDMIHTQESARDVTFSKTTTTPLDEVQEIIRLPVFKRGTGADIKDVDLGDAVLEQLREYVSAVASMYRNNPFHNFEHASHVTMSVVKLLSRIVAPDVDAVNSDLESTLHDYTYGITSDPLTQFACVLSALIHDVDHPGVPNTQLVIENPQLAKFYKDKSVAEQNSVDLSWDLLQDSTFNDLRLAICPTEHDRIRFRQLVVNSVMATDIMDKDLKALRNKRWERAFAGDNAEESAKDAVDRKATIVIEHLIQASDVAHTMQHWHIYRKWNQRLFEELYSAYIQGRSASDPSDNWYKGEIGFFDFYIIPLAKKLRECGVFGVSSDEYLNYAEKNRQEWEARGMEVVAGMVEAAHKKYGTKVK
ncbi:hypothetical protein FisN_20Hh177 [Fistulifera solaris]|uniref:Phosphodiesterase n=1 Tax=Fistulifera solaris TaxID=1519565 RepID=A0A1Z5JJL1_FISSO|nr:hypothetical protein FisN_20Hh177 [Fistulifera solaris]|eukprot:GAX14200.1 hypothetical protein FisN_20Hh177 [Fistulifera solaris]